MRPSPDLFASAAPTYLDRRCPRCRQLKGNAKVYRCVKCGAMLASAEQWEWADAWIAKNLGLVRVAYAKVRPDLARVLDDAEMASECIVGVVRGLLGWRPGHGTKLATYLGNAVIFVARKAKRCEATVDPAVMDRRAAG